MEYIQKHNRLRAEEHAAQLIAEGFTGRDWYITLGFAPARPPRSPETAKYLLTNDFIRRLRAQRNEQGIPTRYMIALNWTPDGMPTEFHCVLSSGQETRGDLERLWPYGVVIRRTLGEMGSLDKVGRGLYKIGQSTSEKGGHAILRSTGFGVNISKRSFPPPEELRRRAGA